MILDLVLARLGSAPAEPTADALSRMLDLARPEAIHDHADALHALLLQYVGLSDADRGAVVPCRDLISTMSNNVFTWHYTFAMPSWANANTGTGNLALSPDYAHAYFLYSDGAFAETMVHKISTTDGSVAWSTRISGNGNLAASIPGLALRTGGSGFVVVGLQSTASAVTTPSGSSCASVTNQGGKDAMVMSLRMADGLSYSGECFQVGTSAADDLLRVASDGEYLYISGATAGDWGNTRVGTKDYFLGKYNIGGECFGLDTKPTFGGLSKTPGATT